MSNARAAGRFTWDGSDAVEETIAQIVAHVARTVESVLVAGELEALVLLGGYGRREGGVEVTNGRELPHNNLDFLLVLRRGDPEVLRRRLDARLLGVARASGIGIDLGVMTASALRHADCRVMWYDMRHGHKTVLGDARFVPSLGRFTVERIPAWDARDLLTNRGSLLVINDLLLERGRPGPEDARLVVKHVVKAILGYGDAWLFFAGDYHWSYAEKRARMRRRRDVDPRFAALYDEAMAFRFRPAYESFLARDLVAWSAAVKEQLSVVHREVEGRRLGRPLDGWAGYLETALEHALWDDVGSARAVLRKVRNAVTTRPSGAGLGLSARAGLAVAGARGALPLLFPAVVYDDAGDALRARAAVLLGAPSTEPRALRRAYLRRWGEVGDPNFANFLARHGLDLAQAGAR